MSMNTAWSLILKNTEENGLSHNKRKWKNGKNLTVTKENGGKYMAKLSNVTLIINPDKFSELKAAFNKLGILGMTVTHVEGCGTQLGGVGRYRGAETDMSLLPKTKVEVVVSAIPVEKVVETAMEVLKSDQIGAGKIFVYDVEKIYRVRTGETDYDALQYNGDK